MARCLRTACWSCSASGKCCRRGGPTLRRGNSSAWEIRRQVVRGLMPLRAKYDSLKEIPAEDVRLYVERDGGWHLDVDLKQERAKLDEFRANNIALTNE